MTIQNQEYNTLHEQQAYMNSPGRISIQPSYFDTFTCLAANCPDTCCKGWIIEIDKTTQRNWHCISNEMRKRGNSTMLPEDHIDVCPFGKHDIRYQIRLNERKECPLLTENKLCSIVLSHGDAMIPKICRDYPRQITEYENLLQKNVSPRCSAVLDLLWDSQEFSYIALEQKNTPCTLFDFPAKALLDGIIRLGNKPDVTSASLLFALFSSISHIHHELLAYAVYDASGYREYGQELITAETTNHILRELPSFMSDFHMPDYEQYKNHSFETCHRLMYQVMEHFFDSPVFGPEFHQLYERSKAFLAAKNVTNLSDHICFADAKLKRLLLEELFSTVLSVETLEYETVLVRLQWLIMQYAIIRYTILIDQYYGEVITDQKLKLRISRIFRVTELPDIQKIAFFDSDFLNWLWTVNDAARLLLA